MNEVINLVESLVNLSKQVVLVKLAVNKVGYGMAIDSGLLTHLPSRRQDFTTTGHLRGRITCNLLKIHPSKLV